MATPFDIPPGRTPPILLRLRGEALTERDFEFRENLVRLNVAEVCRQVCDNPIHEDLADGVIGMRRDLNRQHWAENRLE